MNRTKDHQLQATIWIGVRVLSDVKPVISDGRRDAIGKVMMMMMMMMKKLTMMIGNELIWREIDNTRLRENTSSLKAQ